jgi:hypothetical protein
MSQRKNAVVLTSTAIARLQNLVDAGEYCTLDDAASHIITSVLASARQYSPVLPKTAPDSAPIDAVLSSLTIVPAIGPVPITQDTAKKPLDVLAAMDFDR